MNKAQFLASMKVPTLGQQKIVTESIAAHAYGTTVIVTGVYRETGFSKGKPYTRRGRFMDAWMQNNGDWKCIASQATLIIKAN